MNLAITEACQLIADTSELLNLPPIIVVCGQALYHHVRKHLKENDIHLPYIPVVITFVACKTEEHPCSFIQFLQVLEYFIVKGKIMCDLDPYKVSGKELTASVRERLIVCEMVILRALGFAAYSHADYPHKYIPSLVAKLNLEATAMQAVWSVSNDAMRLDAVTSCTGLEIAFAAIAVALDRIGQSNSRQFTKVLEELQVDPLIVLDIMDKIQGVYKGNAN